MARAPTTGIAGLGVEVVPIPFTSDLVSLHGLLARRSNGTVLLETLGAPGVSILGWAPALTLTARSHSVTVQLDPNVAIGRPPRSTREVPEFMDSLRSRFEVPGVAARATGVPFVGGFLGVAGYEWASAQEGPDRPRAPGVPDLWFGLYDRAVVRLASGEHRLVVVPGIRGARAHDVGRELGRLASRTSAVPVAPDLPTTRLPLEFPRERFESAAREVRRRIRAGDVYQVNLAQRVRLGGTDPHQMYRALRERNPSPFSGILSTGSFSVVSSSPERLLRVEIDPEGRRRATTRPIAGTRPRGRGLQDIRNERAMLASAKERAEHTMLVDLGRNDLGRVCRSGSVEVDEWFTVERYSHVMHLVSNVVGELRTDVHLADLLRALMPGGSVTGTPKIRATEVIRELEPVPRGAFTGSLVYYSLDGSFDSNLLIRSAFYPEGGPVAELYAGAGIVHASNPAREWSETLAKLAALLEAAEGRPSQGFPWAPPRPHRSWRASPAPGAHPGCRVLLIDNYDSFTFNLAQYLGALGASVTVVRNDAESVERMLARRPTHVVLSPGPGRPIDAGVTMAAVRAFEGVPMLGVCLGLQSIVEAYGGAVDRAPAPYHGRSSRVQWDSDHTLGELAGEFPLGHVVGRYHSLVARRVPSSLRVTARTADGLVMAVEHRRYPTIGVQFHPESVLTEGGMTLLDRFLSLSASPSVAAT